MNDGFYTYLLCLKRLGYQPYLDIRRLIFERLGLDWDGIMYPKQKSGPIRDFDFNEDYQLEIPLNSLIRIWIDYDVKPVLAGKYARKRLYLFRIMDPAVTKRIKAFGASFARRGLLMESCVVPRFSSALGRNMDILALGWDDKYLRHVLGQLPEEHYSPKLSLVRTCSDEFQKYYLETRSLIPRNVVLDFSRIIRRETYAYWDYRRNRRRECLAEFEKSGKHAYSWTLDGEVEVNPLFQKKVTREFFLEVMDPVVAKIKETCKPFLSDMATYVQDALSLTDFPFVYAHFKKFLTTPIPGIKRETYRAIGESLCSSTSPVFHRFLQMAKLTPLETVVKETASLYEWTVLK